MRPLYVVLIALGVGAVAFMIGRMSAKKTLTTTTTTTTPAVTIPVTPAA